MTEPGSSRTKPGEDQDGGPEVIAISLEERAFGAVDIGCCTPMYRQRGVLVGVRFFDMRGAGDLLGKRLTKGEQLPGQCGDGGFRQGLSRDNQVVDADGLDLVIRPGRLRVED